MKNEVILVDEANNQIGTIEKLLAHQKGLLHRAVSVFIFNTKGNMLLQQRSKDKYHSGGLWSNTACSHPFPNEKTDNAAFRRLKEEMGLEVVLKNVGNFTYKTEFENGLIEHEFDHLFIGVTNSIPKPEKQEVMDWRYWSEAEIEATMAENPAVFTEWFKLIYKQIFLMYKNSNP